MVCLSTITCVVFCWLCRSIKSIGYALKRRPKISALSLSFNVSLLQASLPANGNVPNKNTATNRFSFAHVRHRLFRLPLFCHIFSFFPVDVVPLSPDLKKKLTFTGVSSLRRIMTLHFGRTLVIKICRAHCCHISSTNVHGQHRHCHLWADRRSSHSFTYLRRIFAFLAHT